MLPAFTIETGRLSMRPLTTLDEALYCDLYTDAETMQFIGPPLTRDRAARNFRKMLKLIAGQTADQPTDQLLLTVIEKSTGDGIGICSLQHIDVVQRRAEGGIMLLGPARSRGYSTEAFRGFLQQIFTQLPIDEVWIETTSDHVVVEQACTSVGFTRCRQAPQDEHRQRCIWSIRRDSWLTDYKKL